MKTIEELYNEINGSDELKKAVSQLSGETELADFLKQHGCEATVKEVAEFMKSNFEGEVGDDVAASAAGGWPDWANPCMW
ncbi:MAG: hypothetical protein J5829_07405 [Lachnospiraceae bacterium]|nr:hypothetical protein [Lachnospiraceae bacterium]